ncbi:MAG: glutathione S-transferase, partial [Pseudomonadota bacterium]
LVKNFPNPLRVRIALAEKQVTEKFEFVSVDVMGGEHRTPEFKAKNINAAVPVLELEDGTCISECPAIIEFIDQSFEGPSLTGTSPKERAVIAMQQRRAESNVVDAVSAYFHHATEGLGPELETYQNAEWGEKQKEKALAGQAYFNSVLAESEFAAGEQFSMADITLFAGLAFADFAGIGVPEEFTNLRAWRNRIAERPSVAA